MKYQIFKSKSCNDSSAAEIGWIYMASTDINYIMQNYVRLSGYTAAMLHHGKNEMCACEISIVEIP